MKTSEPIFVFAITGIRRLARWLLEWTRCRPPLIVAQQDLYSAFGLAQTFLAFARESNALLKQLETFVERQVAVFQLVDDLLQSFERSFKRPALFLTILHLTPRYLRRRGLPRNDLSNGLFASIPPMGGNSFITLSTTRWTTSSSLNSVTFQRSASRRIPSSIVRSFTFAVALAVSPSVFTVTKEGTATTRKINGFGLDCEAKALSSFTTSS